MPKTPEQWLEVASPQKKVRGMLQIVSGLRAGRREDVQHAQRSHPAARSRRGRGDRRGGNARAKGIAELAAQLEAVPRKTIEYKGTLFEELDVDAIAARKPQVVLVDELAHTNIPGSKHRKRYEDVLELVAAKIDVLTTVNIQHIESISPLVRSITGIRCARRCPIGCSGTPRKSS